VLRSFEVQLREHRQHVDPPARWQAYDEAVVLHLQYMVGLANARREALEYAERYLGDHPTHARVIALSHDPEFDRLLAGVANVAHSAREAARDLDRVTPPGASLLPWSRDRVDYDTFDMQRWASFRYLDDNVRCSAAHVAKVQPGPRCEQYSAPRSERKRPSNAAATPGSVGDTAAGAPVPDPTRSPIAVPTPAPASGT
jgi:hypothetical protein